MSNINEKKSFSSMFGSKSTQSQTSNQTTTTNTNTIGTASNSNSQTQQARGSFFSRFVNDKTKPANNTAQVKSSDVSKSTSFIKSQDMTTNTKAQTGSPLRKNSVEIPFDISKLTLEEKIAILEKINAEIEVETKAEKKVMQPTARLTTPLSTTVQASQSAKPTATQLFRSSVQQTTATKPASKPLFSTKTSEAAISTSPQRTALTRRAVGSDSNTGEIKISNEEFIILRDFLYEQCGIFVGENRKYLMENRLNGRLKELGLHNFSEYHNYLKYDKNRLAELNHLFINMTTNETSFFRNNVQLDIFRDKVLAKVIAEQKAKGEKKIHIWSAGCSSGEEPYTIAIIILELLKGEINDWNIKITANDLSPAMLNIARKGVYSEYALRTTPPEIIDKYFVKEGKQYKIIPAAQRLVQFGQINLARSDQLAKVERSHIVFCRNVIIYFDDAMKKHVINAFYDNLLPGGYLLIGHSESLHNISRTFKPEHHPGAIIYCKQS